MDLAARIALLDEVIADPPQVHSGSAEGVWHTDRRCYEFMARTLTENARTLETGLGVSTVLFGVWGCQHTCVVGSDAQVERLTAYCSDRSIDISGVTFEVGYSQDVLPGLLLDGLDLVLIDGGHGYPIPIIDWFYCCRSLRVGGVVAVDDMHLPAVADYLARYLDLDPAWARLAREPKWGAYRRTSDAALGGEWVTQAAFLGGPRTQIANRVKIAAAGALKRTKLGSHILRRRQR